MPAPTFVAAYKPAAQPSTGATTVSVTVAAGDRLVVLGSSDTQSCTLGTPTGGGLTYTLSGSTSGNSGYNNAYAWTSSASASAQTFTLSVTPATGDYWSLSVLRFSGVVSIGFAGWARGSGAPTTTVTTTSAVSSLVFYTSDYNGSDGSRRTWATSSALAVEDGYDSRSGYITDYLGHYPNTGTAGAKTVGLSAPTGQQWSAVVVELVGSTVPRSSGSLALSAAGTWRGSGTQGPRGQLALFASGTVTASGSGVIGGSLALSAPGSLVFVGSGTNRTPPPIIRPIAPLDPYRAGFALWYTVAASVGGVPVPGASGLRPTGGTVTDTTKPGVRRVLSGLTLAPEPGLYDLLSPTGTTLTVVAHVRGTDRFVTDIPMGVFDVDSQSVSDGGGGPISITAPDLWVRIQRAKFVGPAASIPGLTIPQQIAVLIQGALGGSTPVTITSTCTTPVGSIVFDKDREKAILDLAASAAAWVYFDRTGNAVVADLPTIDRTASWLVDASPSGVLISLDRQKSRTATRNVVVVDSTASGGSAFPTQIVWDSDPASATYAGPDPLNHPELAGPFGIAVEYLDDSVLTSAGDAQRAGMAVLSRTVGLASQVSLTRLPNPNVDAFDAIDVLPPKQRSDIPQLTERHIIDTVTHPLDVTQPMQIQGRSTRTDSYS